MADGTIIVCNTNSSNMILNFSTKAKLWQDNKEKFQDTQRGNQKWEIEVQTIQ